MNYKMVAIKRRAIPEWLFALFCPVIVYQPFRWIFTKPTARLTGVELIELERRSQIRKGWTREHDAKTHCDQQIAIVASFIAAHGTAQEPPGYHDQWDILRKHPDDRIHQLAIAGALIAAEIDRLKGL